MTMETETHTARNRVAGIIAHDNSRAAQVFALSIQALIILSMLTFAVETLPGLSPSTRVWLFRVEVVTVAIFTVEYLARLWFAPSRLRFIFSFFGIIDLLAIAPFYLSVGLDLRSIRAFRLLRLFRVLKLGRYSAAVRRLHKALLIAREELVLYVAATGIVMFLASAGIYHFEREAQPKAFASVFHSLWWALCTLTTVGYGDVYPVTVGGRIFTFLVLLAGVGVVTVPAGLFASALTQARKLESGEQAKAASD